MLVHDDERVHAIAEQLQLAACVRVAPRAHAQVYFRGQRLDPELTVSEAGLTPLDRVDVVPEEQNMAFRPIIAQLIWDGDMIARRVDGLDVLLVRLNGVVYAYENRCAHQGVALSEGRLDGHVLTCRAHHWQYDVRVGSGINPATACLRRFEVKVEDGSVFVDVNAPSPNLPDSEDVGDGVGPVLIGRPGSGAVLEAIRRLNPSVEIHERGSYTRVLAPRRCIVTRGAIEDILGRSFDFRAELEIMMPSFKGRMHLDDDEAVWTFADDATGGAEANKTARSHPEMILNAMPSFEDGSRRGDDGSVSTVATGAISDEMPARRSASVAKRLLMRCHPSKTDCAAATRRSVRSRPAPSPGRLPARQGAGKRN